MNHLAHIKVVLVVAAVGRFAVVAQIAVSRAIPVALVHDVDVVESGP
jgi:hypothetical protein